MIEPAVRSALAAVVREYLKGAGFDWRSLPAKPLTPVLWRRPPLVTDLEISGLPIQPHLAMKVQTDLSGLLDVYERFIAGYLMRRTFHDTDSVDWLRKELRITANQARLMFTKVLPGQQRLGYHHNLVQLAALVHYNAKDSVIQRGPDTFKVTTLPDYFVFGVRDGELVTNQTRHARRIAVRGLKDTTDLQLAVRGHGERGEASMLEVIHHWAGKHYREVGQDYDGLMLALRILWWRSKRHQFDTLRSLAFKSSGQEAWLLALQQAGRHRFFEEPLISMQQILVPEFMSLRRFRTLFSNPQQQRATKPSAATHKRWDEVLLRLEAGFEDLTG